MTPLRACTGRVLTRAQATTVTANLTTPEHIATRTRDDKQYIRRVLRRTSIQV